MNSTFDESPYPSGSILDQLFQKYHASGFSAQYFLQYHSPLFFSAIINILLNLSFIFVAVKSRSKLHSPFNFFIAFESFTSIIFASGFLASDLIPLSGQNVVRIEICILSRWPVYLWGPMQNVMMLFISLERLICIIFPIFYRNKLSLVWKHFYIGTVVFLDFTYGGITSYLILSNTLDAKHYYLCNFGEFVNEDGRKYVYRGSMFVEILTLLIYVIILFLIIKARIQRVKLIDSKNMQILRSLLVIMGMIIFGWLINATSPIYLTILQISQADYTRIIPYISLITILASASNGPVLFALSEEYRKCYQSVFPWLLKIGNNQIQPTPVQMIHNN